MTKEYEILSEICKNRKSHRSFLDKPVHFELLEKIKEIALTSPYASGKKNWDIMIIDDKEIITKLAEIVREKSKSMNEYIRDDFIDSYQSYSKNFTMFENAPALIILNYRTPSSFTMMFDKEIPEEIESHLKEWERDNYVKSISCVAMLVLLAAESLGLGATYMTGALLAEDAIKKVIKTKPGRSIGALIPVGYKIKEI